MKYRLKYSPDAGDKLKEIKKQISASNGSDVATRILSKIMKDIRGLQDSPLKGPSVEALLGIPTQYRLLHVMHNYVFYRIEDNTIYITDIYNDREDFMWQLFRVSLRTKESLDYWEE